MSQRHPTLHLTPAERADVADQLRASAELVERVEAEARAATALPWWFWEAAALVFVAVLALSSLFPWGFAS